MESHVSAGSIGESGSHVQIRTMTLLRIRTWLLSISGIDISSPTREMSSFVPVVTSSG